MSLPEDVQSTVLMLRIGTLSMTLLTLVVAVWMGSVARKAYVAGQFPPPGVKVIRKRIELSGRPARRLGIFLGVVAALLAICGIILSLLMWRILATLGY